MIATLSSLLLAAAQATPQTPPADPVPEPDVSLSITAHADSVRWRQVGSVRVRAWSEPSGTVVEENLSTGLPRPIPGQRTFRDVDWTLRGEATIAAPQPGVGLEAGTAPSETTSETTQGEPE
ncbi:hypothetical protein [Brevundimonas sp.]|uniref:hypothetical protein n=1 Tax=Brevundimonas sp. TaxID=1871086 RepID=UPI0035AEF22B